MVTHQQQEKKRYLEDLIRANFVVESRNKTDQLEGVVNTLSSTLGSHDAAIKNMKTQLD